MGSPPRCSSQTLARLEQEFDFTWVLVRSVPDGSVLTRAGRRGVLMRRLLDRVTGAVTMRHARADQPRGDHHRGAGAARSSGSSGRGRSSCWSRWRSRWSVSWGAELGASRRWSARRRTPSRRSSRGFLVAMILAADARRDSGSPASPGRAARGRSRSTSSRCARGTSSTPAAFGVLRGGALRGIPVEHPTRLARAWWPGSVAPADSGRDRRVPRAVPHAAPADGPAVRPGRRWSSTALDVGLRAGGAAATVLSFHDPHPVTGDLLRGVHAQRAADLPPRRWQQILIAAIAAVASRRAEQGPAASRRSRLPRASPCSSPTWSRSSSGSAGACG